MSEDIVETTREEFEAAGPVRPRGTVELERRFFRLGRLRAVLIQDDDGEWASVVLAPAASGGEMRAVDALAGMRTEAHAEARVRLTMRQHEAEDTEVDGEPVTEEQAADLVAEATGKPIEEVRAGIAAAKRSLRATT